MFAEVNRNELNWNVPKMHWTYVDMNWDELNSSEPKWTEVNMMCIELQ